MSNEWRELMIVPQLGGRLMQITFNGHPYLFVNPKYKGKYFPPSSANGEWFNYGGDKLWPLPEGNEDAQHWPGPISDELDDGEYRLKVISRGATCSARLDGPADMRTGLQYSREITIGPNSPQVSFRSIMRNAVNHPIRWAMQTVTQYDTADTQHPSEYNHNFWALTPLNSRSASFGGYQVRNGLANDPSFTVEHGLFVLHWTYLESEVWLDSTAGWLAVNDASSQFAIVERFRREQPAAYPGRASLIFYKNGAALELDSAGMPVLRSSTPEETPCYMEAEINSPMVELKPGEACAMDTDWFPARLAGRVRDVKAAGVIAAPVTATSSSGDVVISASLGVFFPGKLVVHLRDSRGKVVQEAELKQVAPEAAVELQQEIKLSTNPKWISIHLVDNQGIDHGSLGEAEIKSGKKDF